jgi:hypothetical protein
LYLFAGKGAGSFVGGYLISVCGMRRAFRYTGIFSAIFGFVYLAIEHLYLKRKVQLRLEEQASTMTKEEKEGTIP